MRHVWIVATTPASENMALVFTQAGVDSKMVKTELPSSLAGWAIRKKAEKLHPIVGKQFAIVMEDDRVLEVANDLNSQVLVKRLVQRAVAESL